MRGRTKSRPDTNDPGKRFRRCLSALLIAALIHAGSGSAVYAQASHSASELQFDIPSQPLAAALRAYGQATGLEVFYDGSLSIGRFSAAVRGSYPPMTGLRALLRGTGYVARNTEIANTVTIVSAPPVASLRAGFERFQPYFAVLQARFSDALCDTDDSMLGAEMVTLRFWVDPSGVITHAEALGLDGDVDGRRAVAAKLKGLRVGKDPPPGLPQPLTMVVYPPSAGEAAGCSPTNSRRAGN